MSRKHKKYHIGFSVVAILSALAFVASHDNTYFGKNQIPQQKVISVNGSCDTSLWQHVYHTNRLNVITPCLTITGVIDHSKQEADGDIHIRLKLDSQYSYMLNSKNNIAQDGDLVLEPICESSPTQTDAVGACQSYRSNVVVPPIGTRVQVVGSYVLDADHGWNEIHPVTSITVQQ